MGLESVSCIKCRTEMRRIERQGTGQWLQATHFPTTASSEVSLSLALA